MIMNGMKIELKAIWEKKLKVYHYVLKLDEFHMVKRLLATFVVWRTDTVFVKIWPSLLIKTTMY